MFISNWKQCSQYKYIAILWKCVCVCMCAYILHIHIHIYKNTVCDDIFCIHPVLFSFVVCVCVVCAVLHRKSVASNWHKGADPTSDQKTQVHLFHKEPEFLTHLTQVIQPLGPEESLPLFIFVTELANIFLFWLVICDDAQCCLRDQRLLSCSFCPNPVCL